MSLSKPCSSSQVLLAIKPGLLLYQFSLDIVFKQPGEDGKPMKKMLLSESKNNTFKQYCRLAIKNCHLFDGVPFVYDGRKIMWTPVNITENALAFEWNQQDLSEELRHQLVNENGILQLSIQPSKCLTLSDFAQSVHGFVEDRTWRSIVELAISEWALTRERNRYILGRSGQLFETEEHVFRRGLVWRAGHKKGAQTIKDQNGQARMCFAMDYCRKPFFRNDENLLEFYQNFIADPEKDEITFDTFQKLCQGLVLTHVANHRRILYFKDFVADAAAGDVPQVAMKNADELFSLDQLIIKKEQQVNVEQLTGKLREAALQLNRFEAAERKQLILEQLKQLELDNPIMKAFGIAVDESMMKGTFEIFSPMNTVAANGVKLFPFENGAFKLEAKNYLKRAKIDCVIILASKYDYQRTLSNLKKIVSLTMNRANVDSIIRFQEFDLYCEEKDQWLAVFEKIKNDFDGKRILVLAVDGPYVAHYFLKYAESQKEVKTQQIMAKTVIYANPTTMQYISHKVNMKMDGLNLMVQFGANVPNLDLMTGKVLVISLDVCHATGKTYKGATTEPSTIGVSADYLEHPQEFGNFFFFGPTREEIVDTNLLMPYVEQIILETLRHRSVDKIVFIRDGVDEGRYSKVVEEEEAAIRAAAQKCGIKAKLVTFLITKRITTRHFDESTGRPASLPPRSFVHFGTRFGFKQFYMSPHRAINGTAVSIQVTMLSDDIGISKPEAQEFLLGLTYLHQIVNSPISIPSPLHMADEIQCLQRSTFFRNEFRSVPYQALSVPSVPFLIFAGHVPIRSVPNVKNGYTFRSVPVPAKSVKFQ